jgi:hypothetical protein
MQDLTLDAPWPGTKPDPTRLPRDMAARSQAITERLRAARRQARSGEILPARLACADIVLHDLPLLTGDERLLGQTVETLVHLRAFQLLTRLLAAVDGRTVRVTVGGALECTPGAALIAHAATGGVETFTVSESLFHHPAGEAVIHGWSDALAHGRPLPEAVRTAA